MLAPRSLVLATAVALQLALLARSAAAVPMYIDRTRRTIDVDPECATPTPATSQALAYNSPPGAPVVNLAGVEGRFTLVLSTTATLLARTHNNPFELSWYNFAVGNASYDAQMTDGKRLIRAYVMLRCGLPVTPGDSTLYQVPAAGPARTNFIEFAMGHRAGADPRTATGYRLIGNGEREAMLMYAAERIKFDLTPTIIGRGRVCTQYYNLDHASGCATDVAPLAPVDAVLGYLYEGMNRISYTGHEFWMMRTIPEYRAKVFFTNGTAVVMGQIVDQFVMQLGGVNSPAHDPGGNTSGYPANTLPDGRQVYRFQDVFMNANNEAVFYQTTLPAFLAQYHPRSIVTGSLL